MERGKIAQTIGICIIYQYLYLLIRVTSKSKYPVSYLSFTHYAEKNVLLSS